MITIIKFFSNHTDTTFIKEFSGEDVSVIKHPYILPEWSIDEILNQCSKEIKEAVDAEKLIINGDYTLVTLITTRRFALGKPTGFLAMKKMNEPSNAKDANGNIIHTNVLKPIAIRWVDGTQ